MTKGGMKICMNKYVVVTCVGSVYVVEADTVGEASEEIDWKYPGTVISVTLLPREEET